MLEVAPAPAAGRGGQRRAAARPRAAVELLEQLNSLFGLRHCGRELPRRQWPSAYGQMGRCLSPCLGDLDPNLYRRRLDEALALFTGRGDGGAALLAHVDAQMRAAAAAASASSAPRGCGAAASAWLCCSSAWRRAGGDARPAAARARRRPAQAAAHDASGSSAGASSTGGRSAASTTSPSARAPRCAAATARGDDACLPPDEVDEARIVATWLDRNPSPALDLTGGADRGARRRVGRYRLARTRRGGTQLRIEGGVASRRPGARDPSLPA